MGDRRSGVREDNGAGGSVGARPGWSSAALCAVAASLAFAGSVSAQGDLPLGLPEVAFSAGVPDPVSAEPWWRAEEDEALVALLEEGIAENHDLRAAWERVVQARARVQRAGSPLYPALSFDGSASVAPAESLGFMFGAGGLASAGGEAPETYTSTTATLNARWQLDVWGRQVLQRRATLLEAAAASGDRKAQALALASRLAAAYYDLVAAVARVAIVERQIASNQSLLELTELRFRQGAATALDVLQQRQQLAATSTLLPQARLLLRTGEQQLALMLGRDPASSHFDVAGALPEWDGEPAVGRPEALLDNRPDLRAALARYQAARSRARSANRAVMPALSVSGKAGNQALYLTEWNSQWYWSAGATLSVPLFNGGSQAAAIREARSAERAAYHALYQAYLGAVREVEQALVQEAEMRAQVRAYRDQLDAARQALEESRSRYVAGLTNYQSVLTATNALQQAELNELQAHRQLVGARILLHTALGGPWAVELTMEKQENRE